MKKAYGTGDYTMQQIADALGVLYSTVSRALHKTSLKNACLQDLYKLNNPASPQHHN